MNLKHIILFITIFNSFSFPQVKELGSDFNRFFKTGKDVFVAPSNWEKTDRLIFSGTIVVTSGTFLADKHARIFSKPSFGYKLFSIDHAFNVTIPATTIVGIYGCGLIFD